MNPGGEPDRDDFGLPPVDIEIPDDARELDRDVQAYHREQRALRRQRRLRRLYRPVAGDGVVMPLLAGCLIFALIAAVVLTVFTASGDVIPRGQASGPGSSAGAPTSVPPGHAPAPVRVSLTTLQRHLPDNTVSVGGRKVRLRSLAAAALALVPRGCNCTSVLRELIMQAGNAGVPLYLVGSAAAAPKLSSIAASASPAVAKVAVDEARVLAKAFPASAGGPSVILVRFDHSLQLARTLPSDFQLHDQLLALREPGN